VYRTSGEPSTPRARTGAARPDILRPLPGLSPYHYLGALLLALLHASLPTHWLPFVLFGHAHRWPRRKILRVTFLAGGGHVTATTALGFAVAWVGKETAERVEAAARPVAAAVLFVSALYFLARDLFAGRDTHSKSVHTAGGTGAVVALVAFLTFSPCGALLPAFFVAGPHGWGAVVILAALVGIVTIAAILVLVALAYEGASRVDLHVFERYEGRLIASLLAALGLAVLLLEP